MDIDQPGSSRQDGSSYSPEARNLQLNNIRSLYFYLIHKYEGDAVLKVFQNDKNINIDRSNAYAGFISTIYLHIRKMNNPDERKRGNTHGDNECILGNMTHTVAVLAEEFKKSSYGQSVVWDFKLATPIVDMLTAFKIQWDEDRVSPSKFRGRNQAGNIVDKGITTFGLSNVHLPLLSGLTFKPERRTGLMRTLGPLTLCIMLAQERGMHEKMVRSLKESLKNLPMCESIVDCLRDARSVEECRSLLTNLGDLLLITGSRSTNKIFFPIEFVMKANDNDLDFSGIKGIQFYLRHAPKYSWLKKTNGNCDQVNQAVFHAMFGTACEDLGVLGSITNNTRWENRKAIDMAYNAKDAQSKHFTPILFHKISKLAAASMTRGGATAQPMLINKIVFAGNRKRVHSNAFLGYLESGSRQLAYGRDVASLSAALVKLKESFTQKIRAGGMDKAGTTEWLDVDGNEVGDFVAKESGNYFYT